MEIGFNDDVEYNDVVFHIQTEDHGLGDPRVSTQLFTGGRVLDNRTVSYAHLIEEIPDEEDRRQKIRKVMIAAHRNVYRRLLSGEYDETMGFSEVAHEQPEEVVEDEVEAFVPSQSRVPETAQVVEEDGRVTFTFETGESIDLKSLRQQLNEVDLFPNEGTGAALFEDLADDFAVDFDEAEARASIQRGPTPKETSHGIPMPGAAVGHTQVVSLPAFGSTGRRAFQGLLEPPSNTAVLDMVLEYLATEGRAG